MPHSFESRREKQIMCFVWCFFMAAAGIFPFFFVFLFFVAAEISRETMKNTQKDQVCAADAACLLGSVSAKGAAQA